MIGLLAGAGAAMPKHKYAAIWFYHSHSSHHETKAHCQKRYERCVHRHPDHPSRCPMCYS